VRPYVKEFVFYPDILLWSLILLLLGIALALLPKSGWQLLFFVSGAILFIWMEYLTHRYFFHLPPPKNKFLLRLLKRLHYDHHEEPLALDRLFLPIWYSGPQFLLIGSIVYVWSGQLSLTLAFTAGLLVFHLLYEWRHYVAHRPIQPRTAWGKRLKKWHLLHHYKNESYWFGVSQTWMDQLFQTDSHERDVSLSLTAKRAKKG